MADWDTRFLDLAFTVAGWSKDRSTRVGAVIVRPDRTVSSLGFNGFPRRTTDDPDLYATRDEKLRRTVHAELNAILSAHEPVRGHSIYTTFHPCAQCAAAIIQSGIRRVCVPLHPLPDRWMEDYRTATALFDEAGVNVDVVIMENAR